MEKQPEHIDQIFKKRLHDHAAAPPAFVWDNLEKQLRKRRRRLFIWLFTFGVAGAGLLAWWLTDYTSPGLLASNKISVNQSAASTATEQRSTTNHQTQYQISENTSIATNFEPTKPAVKTNPTPTPAFTAKSVISTTEQLQIKTPDSDTRSETPDAEPQVTLPGDVGKETGYSLSLLPFESRLEPVEAVTISDKAQIIPNAWPKWIETTPVKPKAKKPNKNCYDFAKNPNVWIIEAYGGPSLAQRELVSAPDSRPYLNKRLNSESPDLAFNTGIRAALMLRGNFLLRTGFQYDQYTEVFEHIDPEYIKYIVAIENNGGVITVDTIGVEYGEKYLKTYNRFGLLDIPISAGFEFRKGRSGFNINAGLTLNLMFWKRGAILSPADNQPAWFTPGLSDPNKPTIEVFKNKTGVSASASIQWFYHLKPRTRVFVEPYFKRILKPVSLNTHPVQQRYGIGGIRLGVAQILK